ncbi:RodZ family helix-turn-helix domain-containing protein, partial [Sansalvadorimonas verongulae]|uniref:hypothetical protein n=1 Tax=Sansalvadorimonas verongulae TaxID=2172824 RepID=UPI0012BD15D4
MGASDASDASPVMAVNRQERIKYHDPEGSRYEWAAALRPHTCGKHPGSRALDQWLIETISQYCPKENPDNYCIIGSRVLQRILGTRYLDGDLEAGRDIYHSFDIDMWVKSPQDQTELESYIIKKVKEVRRLVCNVTELSNFEQGICQHSIKISRPEGDGTFTPLSSVDISHPLFDVSSPPASISEAKERLNRFINSAARIPMTQTRAITGELIGNAPRTLSDMAYLQALDEALSNPSCSWKIYEKLQDTVRMLTYMEVTRRLGKKEPVDDFCNRLIEVVCHHLPDEHKFLKVLLPSLIGKQAVANLPLCFSGPLVSPRVKELEFKATLSSQLPKRESKAIPIVPDTASETVTEPETITVTDSKPATSWAEIAQRKPEPIHRASQPPSPTSLISSWHISPKFTRAKTSTKLSPLATHKPSRYQPEKKTKTAPAATNYLTKEQLTPELLSYLTTQLDQAKSYEKQIAILFDEGISMAMLEDESEDDISIIALRSLLKSPPHSAETIAPTSPAMTSSFSTIEASSTPKARTRSDSDIYPQALQKASSKGARGPSPAIVQLNRRIAQLPLPPVEQPP